MIDIENRAYAPGIEEMRAWIDNPAFDALHAHMQALHAPLVKIEYSGDKILLGWNLKYKKAGKTLCTVYPRKGHFPLLLVVGKKEKPRVEALLPSLSQEFRRAYAGTREGMGQRWLLFDIAGPCELINDIYAVVKIRRENP